MRERGLILALVDDLLMRSRVEASCHAAGWTVQFPDSAEAVWTQLGQERPVLVLVGVASTRLPWEALVAALKANVEFAGIPVVAFGPHMDLVARQRARAAGCDRVVANSLIAADLPGLLGQLGITRP